MGGTPNWKLVLITDKFLHIPSYFPHISSYWHVSCLSSGELLNLEIATSPPPNDVTDLLGGAKIFQVLQLMYREYISSYFLHISSFYLHISPLYELTKKHFQISPFLCIPSGTSKNLEIPPYLWALGLGLEKISSALPPYIQLVGPGRARNFFKSNGPCMEEHFLHISSCFLRLWDLEKFRAPPSPTSYFLIFPKILNSN